jgi:hypothetical protein
MVVVVSAVAAAVVLRGELVSVRPSPSQANSQHLKASTKSDKWKLCLAQTFPGAVEQRLSSASPQSTFQTDWPQVAMSS